MLTDTQRSFGFKFLVGIKFDLKKNTQTSETYIIIDKSTSENKKSIKLKVTRQDSEEDKN